MKKTLIALAALAATGAFAQSTVEIYGRAHVAYDFKYQTTNGTTAGTTTASNLANRNRVADDGSRIGFRIREDLGGGLSAFSVIETGINLDTATNNGQSGAANSGSGFFGTREAHVGVGNSSVELRLGRQNVFWGNGPIEDVSANRLSGGVISSYTAPSSGLASGPAARQDNTVKFLGGSALGGFAGSEIWISTPNNAEQTAATKVVNNKASGLTLRYVTGPFAVQFDTAQNKNSNNGVDTAATYAVTGAASNTVTTALGIATYDSTVKGQKLGLAYTYAPGSKVYFINSTFETTFTTASVNNASPVAGSNLGNTAVALAGARKQSANSLGLQHVMGNWELHAQYVNQGNATDYAGAAIAKSGSKAQSIGARYSLSKRTAVTGSYNVINNEAANNINMSGGGQSSVAAMPFGADIKVIRASIQHAF